MRLFPRRRPATPDAAPSVTDLLTDLLEAMHDISADLRVVREVLEDLDPTDLRADVRAVRDRVELATDPLDDARRRTEDGTGC